MTVLPPAPTVPGTVTDAAAHVLTKEGTVVFLAHRRGACAQEAGDPGPQNPGHTTNDSSEWVRAVGMPPRRTPTPAAESGAGILRCAATAAPDLWTTPLSSPAHDEYLHYREDRRLS